MARLRGDHGGMLPSGSLTSGDMSVALHESFMALALQQAQLAARMGEVPVGAVVVRHNQVIGAGHNLRETARDPTAHAELVAMRAAAQQVGSWRLDACTVYVTLEPCPMCAGAMVLARVGACVYGASDPKGGFLGTLADLSQFPGLNHQFAVVRGILRDPCGQVLRQFFRAVRAKQRG